MSEENSLLEYKARIQNVIDYVEKNVRSNLPLEVLAEVSSFSPYHFHGIFRAFVGETPNEYVSRIRLEKAAGRLITYVSEPITDVASRCGFKSSAAFARAFREHFGCSATEWREGRLASLLNDRDRKANRRKRNATPPEVPYVIGEAETTITGRTKEVFMKAEIKSMPRFHLAYLAHIEEYNEKIGKLFDRLRYWAVPRGLLTPGTKFIGISLDNPKITPPEKCRYYACMTVPEDISPDKEIGLTDIPAARCAVSRLEGNKHEIQLAYDEMYGKFIPEKGYQPADRPAYEIYHDGPKKNPSHKFTLELCVPVETLVPVVTLSRLP